MEITSIIQHIFKQPSLEGVSLSELERFTAKQPFFAVGQYLLLRKMQDIRDPGFEKQLQKTRLYFENPLWLQQLLLRKTEGVITVNAQEENVHQQPEFTTTEQEIEDNGSVREQTEIVERAVRVEDEIIVEDVMITVTEDDIYSDGPEPVETIENSLPRKYPEQPIAEAQPVEEIEQLNVVEFATEEPGKEFTDKPVVEFITADLPENSAIEIVTKADPIAENIESDSTENPDNSQDLTPNEEGKPGFVLPAYTKPAEQTEEQLVFQAYHTIDYFASQGIKISQKAEMSDKLGSQLRSFTEWLKTMKRLPPAKLEQQMEEKESEVVVELAAHSLESKEILTETMAEVLLKQGKKDSAIEVYNKLSLLNPSKTPYFAAKIEEIKRN